MRRFRSGLIAGMCLLAFTSAGFAQDEVYGGEKNQLVLSLNGRWWYQDNDNSKFEEFSFYGTLGYFASRHHEVGFLLSPTFTSTEAKSDGSGQRTTVVEFSPYYQYNFYVPSAPRVNLYAGGNLGLVSLDTDKTSSETNLGWGLTVGMRYWLSTQVSLNLQPRFTRTTGDIGNQNNFLFLFGVAALL